MGDMGDIFRAWREEKKSKKQQNVVQSLDNLQRHQVPFTVLNQGIPHLLVSDNIDYWPSTGLWRDRRSLLRGRGVFKLISFWKRNYQASGNV